MNNINKTKTTTKKTYKSSGPIVSEQVIVSRSFQVDFDRLLNLKKGEYVQDFDRKSKNTYTVTVSFEE